jgi:hypothetical protein
MRNNFFSDQTRCETTTVTKGFTSVLIKNLASAVDHLGKGEMIQVMASRQWTKSTPVVIILVFAAITASAVLISFLQGNSDNRNLGQTETTVPENKYGKDIAYKSCEIRRDPKSLDDGETPRWIEVTEVVFVDGTAVFEYGGEAAEGYQYRGAACGFTQSDFGETRDEPDKNVGGGNNQRQPQSPAQNSRYVTETSCRVTQTYTDAYGSPTRYDLQITTYYSDGTQMSTGRISNVPC